MKTRAEKRSETLALYRWVQSTNNVPTGCVYIRTQDYIEVSFENVWRYRIYATPARSRRISRRLEQIGVSLFSGRTVAEYLSATGQFREYDDDDDDDFFGLESVSRLRQ